MGRGLAPTRTGARSRSIRVLIAAPLIPTVYVWPSPSSPESVHRLTVMSSKWTSHRGSSWIALPRAECNSDRLEQHRSSSGSLVQYQSGRNARRWHPDHPERLPAEASASDVAGTRLCLGRVKANQPLGVTGSASCAQAVRIGRQLAPGMEGSAFPQHRHHRIHITPARGCHLLVP